MGSAHVAIRASSTKERCSKVKLVNSKYLHHLSIAYNLSTPLDYADYGFVPRQQLLDDPNSIELDFGSYKARL
jgi:hypothetical protein